ncbi:uncharacterized protein LOC127095448 [Lathyrus oleraceus]|uniref:uncharacterized protein LOC127095448 n=1 Tax=Pisum sativum TaxID=3888 RepID=UPI0021D31755|nr:uncharacterized protein LOC127095448 [Pisum sativum]
MVSLQYIPDFNYHPNCAKLKITNVCFAYDLILFSIDDERSVQHIMDVFKKFYEATGLKANPAKCNIFFGGTSMPEQQNILTVFPMPKKIIKQIETICRNFLWYGKATGRKAYVSWEKICEPKNVGGLNIKDLNVWNNLTLLKLWWNLHVNDDKL